MEGIADEPLEATVLVIGGGPVGLTASGLLSKLGVRNVVVERRRGTQPAPAAHVLRRKPLEVLGLLGLGEEIEKACPDLPLHYITWCATLGGVEAGRIDFRGGDPIWTNCSQNRLEPILMRHAAAQPEARVLVGSECVGLAQDDEGVRATIRGDHGDAHEVHARWAIAADGAASPTRRALEIPMIGQGALGRFFMIHVEADLRPWIRERPGALYWILNPEAPGTLIVHDPASSHVFMTPMFGAENEEETLGARLAAALDVPARTEILSVATWSPHVQVAERYREGRVFLAGDAAHRFPPTGGLGLNTGILDVHNLVAKLAVVEAGRAPVSILDRYQDECRPAAVANAEASFENLKGLGEISRAIGECETLTALEHRLGSMSAAEAQALVDAIENQRSHFSSEGHFPRPVQAGDGAI